LSFKAKKTVPRQYAKYVEKSLLLPAAAYTMSFINNLTSKPNNTSQSKQIVVGPPKNLEDMRSRYAYTKVETNNPIIQELEDTLASLDPKKVIETKHYGYRYDNDNTGETKKFRTTQKGTEEYNENWNVGRYMIDEFYDANSSCYPIGVNYYDENGCFQIERETNDGRIITKSITKDEDTNKNKVEYSVLYDDKDSSAYKLKEIGLDSNGTIVSIYFKMPLGNKEITISNNNLDKDFSDKDESVSHDKEGNITYTTIEDGHKFVINISKTGDINSVKEIPCEEKYSTKFIEKRPEFKKVKEYWENIEGPYGLDNVCKFLLDHLDFINILQQAKNKDGTRRMTESKIIDLALVDPDFGTQKFLDRYLTTDEDVNTIWANTFH